MIKGVNGMSIENATDCIIRVGDCIVATCVICDRDRKLGK